MRMFSDFNGPPSSSSGKTLFGQFTICGRVIEELSCGVEKPKYPMSVSI